MSWLLLWPALFGVWPLAHPEHDASVLGATDIAVHVAASVELAWRRWEAHRARQRAASRPYRPLP